MAMGNIFNRSVLITKSDTVNFDGSTYSASAATKAIPAESIFVGGAGIVVAVFEDGSTVSQKARGLDFDSHVGQLELDGLQ